MDIQLQIVIAYYNHLDFFNTIKNINYSECIIYNKSQSNILLEDKIVYIPDSKINTIESLANIGREGETYLHHIIKNYDNFSEYTLFIQDDTDNHIHNIQNFINKTERTMKNMNPIHQYETTWDKNEKITNRLIRNGRCHLSTFSHDYAIRDACKELNIELPSIYITPTCAFFILHKDTIKKRTKEFYVRIRTWLLQKEENGYILEHLWKIIFDGENTGITEKKEPRTSLTDLVNNMASSIITRSIRKHNAIRKCNANH